MVSSPAPGGSPEQPGLTLVIDHQPRRLTWLMLGMVFVVVALVNVGSAAMMLVAWQWLMAAMTVFCAAGCLIAWHRGCA